MTTNEPTVSLSFTPDIPGLLSELGCSLALTSPKGGKVMFISAKNAQLSILSRAYDSPMTMAFINNKLAIATKDKIVVNVNSPVSAYTLPEKPQTYDALFLPRAAYYCGQLNIREMTYGKAGLWAVNSCFSCLSIIDENFSFSPQWKPPFITELVPENRCHLNGLASDNGEPAFVSALGATNTANGWKEDMLKGGVLIHVASGEIVASGLASPHTPRIYGGKLFVLLASESQLVCIDTQTGKYEIVCQLSGFLRGMSRFGDYVFVCTSKLRPNSPVATNNRKLERDQPMCGISVIHLPSGKKIGSIMLDDTIDEIYDIKVLPGMKKPNLIAPETLMRNNAVVTPTQSFWT